MPSILDAWKFLLKDVTAPDIFIESTFYFMISAALQRRVWVSSTESPIFPNIYMILIGPPGVGKGVALNPMASILRHHLINPLGTVESQKDKLDPDLLIALEEYQTKILDQQLRNPDNIEPALLFPVGADSTSFESMVQDAAKSISRFKCKEPNPLAPTRVYTHNSIAYVLPEMSSMFHSHSNRIVQFLTVIYDCQEYKYKTKHQGTDRIKKPCVSFIAGTTPADIKRLFREGLVDDGFTARFLFVYADKNRFYRFNRPELEPEQIAAKALITEYIRGLSTVFGKVNYAPDADEYFKTYYMSVMTGNARSNLNTKLDSYYPRLNLHLQKLAMAIHFSKSTDLLITLDDAVETVDYSKRIEEKMHLGLSSIGSNPLYGPTLRVMRLIKMHIEGVTLKQIWEELEGDVREAELKEILSTLMAFGKIDMRIKDNKEIYLALNK